MMSTKQAMVLTGHHEIPWMPAWTPSLSSDLGLAHFLRTVGPAPPHRLGLTVEFMFRQEGFLATPCSTRSHRVCPSHSSTCS